ncbi:MAG: SdpA family antimicrobial peptide system protein [Kangiellaceae bacterium]|nr:SdpA family antimicrobial peptide system protein [Kangiellaceae bacterium]
MKKYLNSLVFILTSSIYALLIVKVFFTSLPYNPIKSNGPQTKVITSFFPEGWAFFTRDSRESQTLVYSIDSSSLAITKFKWLQNSHYSNYFGLDKKSRYMGVELAYLLNNLKPTDWSSCRELTREKIKTLKVTEVENELAIKNFKGLLLIQKKEPIPWAWHKSSADIEMPSKVILINVK